MSGVARAIGSVLPMARAPAGALPSESIWAAWTAGHRHVAAYGSARSALAALLRFRAVRRVWLPAYACATLAEAAKSCVVAWYGTGLDLAPDLTVLEDDLRGGDAVLAIDYFGRCSGPHFAALAARRPDVLWIQDRVQALASRGPSWGEVALTSPRKLIGVAEGGLLVSDAPLPVPADPPAERSAGAQIAREADPDASRPDLWFPAFQAQEAAFAVDDAAMGTATMRVLQGIAVAPLVARRRKNASRLALRLRDLALWPKPPPGFAPLGFPIRVRQRDRLAAALADEGIYCAQHWPNLPSDPTIFPQAHRLAGELLSLPCDHRYGPADMDRIVASIRRHQSQYLVAATNAA